MANIEIYVTKTCPYCERAKALLNKKGAAFQIIDVSDDADLRAQMMQRAEGRRTVPQIFINNTGIGGCDDLYALDAKGQLDSLLSAA